MLTLNIYGQGQKTITKTVTAEAYDLSFGVLDDVIGLVDTVGNDASEAEIMRAITANWGKLKELLLDIFPELEPEDLRHVKIKELIPIALELIRSVVDGLSSDTKKKIQQMMAKA